MSQYLINQMHEAAESNDWDRAISIAKKIHPRYEAFDLLASDHVIPPSHIKNFLLSTPKNSLPNVLFEVAHNLHPELKHEHLDFIDSMAGEDHLVRSKLESHRNWNPLKNEKSTGEMAASNFWRSYERKVHPVHFATIKSMFTGKPETIRHHRDDSEAHSHGEHYISHMGTLLDNATFKPPLGNFRIHDQVLPHLPAHAKKVQQAILEDDNIPKRIINGVPHIQLFRGVGGKYAKKLHDAVNSGAKAIKIKKAPFSSWTIDPNIARNFAIGRGMEGLDDGYPHTAIISHWIPVDKVLHSGFHTVHASQKHAHPQEYEIVVGHPEGHIIAHSQNIKLGQVKKDKS